MNLKFRMDALILLTFISGLAACKTPNIAKPVRGTKILSSDTIIKAQYQDQNPTLTWTTAGDSKAVFTIQECDVGEACATIFTVDCSTGVCNPKSGEPDSMSGPIMSIQHGVLNQKIFTLELCNLTSLAQKSTTQFQIISGNNPPVQLQFNNALSVTGHCR